MKSALDTMIGCIKHLKVTAMTIGAKQFDELAEDIRAVYEHNQLNMDKFLDELSRGEIALAYMDPDEKTVTIKKGE